MMAAINAVKITNMIAFFIPYLPNVRRVRRALASTDDAVVRCSFLFFGFKIRLNLKQNKKRHGNKTENDAKEEPTPL